MARRTQRSVLKKIAARRRTRPCDFPGPPVYQIRGTVGMAPSGQSVAFPANRILTRREVEVLRLVAHGETDRGIADRLYVSRRTVSSHVSHILAKLDVPWRRTAVATAMRIGIL